MLRVRFSGYMASDMHSSGVMADVLLETERTREFPRQKVLAKLPHRIKIRRMPLIIRNAALVALLATLSACSIIAPSTARNTSKTFTTVVVDAGHGGKDSGAYRKSGPPEKLVTLDVAKRLDQKLRESQIHTVMTRSSDVFIELDERVRIENRQKNAI